MSQYSLQASISTSAGYVNTGEASRWQSLRLFNPAYTWCCPRGGTDLVGRQACQGSLVTETAGCDMGCERVLPENNVRPLSISGQQLTNVACGLGNPGVQCVTQPTVWANGHYGYNNEGQVYPNSSESAYASAEKMSSSSYHNRLNEVRRMAAKGVQKDLASRNM